MKSIKQIMDDLPHADREMLQYSFEMGFPDKYIEYEPGRFIGVYITKKDLKIEQQEGYWVEGILTAHTIKFPAYSAYDSFEEQSDDNTRHGGDLASN